MRFMCSCSSFSESCSDKVGDLDLRCRIPLKTIKPRRATEAAAVAAVAAAVAAVAAVVAAVDDVDDVVAASDSSSS